MEPKKEDGDNTSQTEGYVSTARLSLTREECLYTSCYCEENVYKLCDKISSLRQDLIEGTYAVFISNESQTIPIWRQRSGNFKRQGLVVWDYHVILIVQYSRSHLLHGNNARQGERASYWVYDLDTDLSFPCGFDSYISSAIQPDREQDMDEQYHRKFRVIPGRSFLAHFSSDRSRMISPETGDWISPPPPWEPILKATTQLKDGSKTEDEDKVCSNLNDYINMTSKTGSPTEWDPCLGRVMSPAELMEFFGAHSV